MRRMVEQMFKNSLSFVVHIPAIIIDVRVEIDWVAEFKLCASNRNHTLHIFEVSNKSIVVTQYKDDVGIEGSASCPSRSFGIHFDAVNCTVS